MGLLTISIIAATSLAAAFAPLLLAMLALMALAMGLMGLFAQIDGQEAGLIAKQPAGKLIPARVLIALHEPPLRSMTGERAIAPSRAPPSCRHLLSSTESPIKSSADLSRRFDCGSLRSA